MCDQYPVGRDVSSSYFCSNTHPTCVSHASVSNVICHIEFGIATTGCDTNDSSSEIIEANYLALRGPIFVG